MSRTYELEIFAKGISARNLLGIAEWFGWVETFSGYSFNEDMVLFIGKGCLAGCETEEEIHKAIDREVKKVNAEAKARTRWFCLEYPGEPELPYSQYGSLEDDEAE